MATRGRLDLEGLAGLSGLDGPIRLWLYEYVIEHDEPVSRGRTATGIGRTLVAHHLDKPADAGLPAPSISGTGVRDRGGQS